MHNNNITAAQAVAREFVDIVCPLGLFRLPVDWLWRAFGLNLGPTCSFGLPLGPLGAPWDPLGVPWGSLGDPWKSPGVPWGALGCPRRFSQICQKLDAQFRANVSICTRLRIESSLPSFARPAHVARGNGSQSAAQTLPGHTRRGLGLRELNKFPQTTSRQYNKQFNRQYNRQHNTKQMFQT